MTTISNIQMNLGYRFAQRKPCDDYSKLTLLYSAIKKCCDDDCLLTDSEKYVLREIFRDPFAQQGNDNELLWEIVEFIQKTPFVLVSVLENMRRLVKDSGPTADRLSEDCDNATLACRLSKEVSQLRQRQFVKDMSGRSARERSSLAREHICVANDLQPFVENLTVDFTVVDATEIDFTGLDLRLVQFGRNSIEGSLFLDTNVTLAQLKDVKSFKNARFADDFAHAFLALRKSDFEHVLSVVAERIEETQMFDKCFSKYYFLASENGNMSQRNVEIYLQEITDVELHYISYMLLNDSSINLLPSEHEWNYEICNESRKQIMEMSRQELLNILQSMMEARDFYLPMEVLSHSIDHKLYMLQVSLEELKDKLSYFMESLPSFPDPMQHQLTTASTGLKNQVKALHVQLENERTDNNRTRVNMFLAGLNLPVDKMLSYGPTDRLIECIKLAGMIPDTVVNLIGRDLSEVDWNRKLSKDEYGINFSTGVIIAVTPADEAKLPERLINQRYGVMYALARAGKLQELDDYITMGRLDANRQEDLSGRTALHYACGYAHPHVARMLIEKHAARTDLKTAFGWDIVDVLAESTAERTDPFLEGWQFLQFLMDRGVVLNVFQVTAIGDLEKLKKFPDKDLRAKCPLREKAVLEIAADRGYVEMIRYLKQKNVPFEDKTDYNPLWLAAERGHCAAAELIATICPNLTKKKRYHATPIQAALEKNHFSVVEALYKYEANGTQEPQLVAAVSNLDAVQDIVTEALKARKQDAAKNKDIVQKLLFFAVFYGKEPIIKYILSKCGESFLDFEYRFRDYFDRRLIDQACEQGNVNAMRLLFPFKGKFDVNASTVVCPPLLYIAVTKKNFAMISLLLDEFKVSVHFKQAGKNILQHLMIVKKLDDMERFEIAKKLIALECNVFELDTDGKSLLHYAVNVNVTMMRLIVQAQMKAVNKLAKTNDETRK